LTGFALKILKADPQQIGISAALPTFANLNQIFGSYLVETTGERKKLCIFCFVAHRGIWILITMLPLAIFSTLADWRIWVLVGVIGLSSLLGSLSGIAWRSWMSDLVPEQIRGSYFGKRNMISSACGMVTILLGGKFLSTWETRF
jgi:MFS family permease